MRIIPFVLGCLMLALAPLSGFAAGPGVSVRGIAFVASNEPGQTDPRLAPYESTLRSNLRFESFRYVGESSASVPPNGTASLSLPGGGRVDLQADAAGNLRAQRGGTAVTISRGRPAVFIGGPSGRGGVAGIIVLAN